MDAMCKIQGSIHVFSLAPKIKMEGVIFLCPVIQEKLLDRTQICIFGLSNYAISLSIPMFGY